MKKEAQNLLKALCICFILCMFIALGMALLLRTPLLAGQKAYLFRLLALTVLLCALLLAVFTALYAKGKALFGLNYASVVMCVGLSTLFMALFFSIGCMPIERSYTIYSLADMTDHPDTVYTSEEIKTRFVEGYVEEAQESQKRIDEQVYIGNMEAADGGYRITEKGESLVRLYRLIEAVFPVPDEHSIYPNGK